MPKKKKEQLLGLILIEVHRINVKEKQNADKNNSNIKEKEKYESYYMFQDDSDSPSHSLQLKKKIVVLQYLTSSTPGDHLFLSSRMIMRPHKRQMSDQLFEKLVVLKSHKFWFQNVLTSVISKQWNSVILLSVNINAIFKKICWLYLSNYEVVLLRGYY